MNVSPFPDKLFQRGQTWQECLECWPYQREQLLEQAAQAKPLTKTMSVIREQGICGKWLLIYSVRSTDSLMALPFLSLTWPETPENFLRLFCYEYFFPQFEHLPNRAWPALHILQHQRPRFIWGPRPRLVNEQLPVGMETRHLDQALLEFDQEQYYEALDTELSQAIMALKWRKNP